MSKGEVMAMHGPPAIVGKRINRFSRATAHAYACIDYSHMWLINKLHS